MTVINPTKKPVVYGRTRTGQPLVIQAGKSEQFTKDQSKELIKRFPDLKILEKNKEATEKKKGK